jgi:hypothetical protein
MPRCGGVLQTWGQLSLLHRFGRSTTPRPTRKKLLKSETFFEADAKLNREFHDGAENEGKFLDPCSFQADDV